MWFLWIVVGFVLLVMLRSLFRIGKTAAEIHAATRPPVVGFPIGSQLRKPKAGDL